MKLKPSEIAMIISRTPSVRVRLPYLPPPELNPNAKAHWAVKARAVAPIHADMVVALQQAGWRKSEDAPKPKEPRLQWQNPLNSGVVRFTWGLPNRRRRDWDNLLSATKAILDACPLRDDDVRSIIVLMDYEDSPKYPYTLIEIWGPEEPS